MILPLLHRLREMAEHFLVDVRGGALENGANLGLGDVGLAVVDGAADDVAAPDRAERAIHLRVNVAAILAVRFGHAALERDAVHLLSSGGTWRMIASYRPSSL